ncbi:hypothetical protein MRB53_008979 [Persea americana]|uniref:Uncharacterized protein n=1 Tax=Persea americana TaxID=3435 RepID=A0ACC2LNQ3_PERAE|nr:hypothetical protein MRB53_008979 [Persea americana]
MEGGRGDNDTNGSVVAAKGSLHHHNWWALDEDLGGAWEIGAIVWFLDLFDYYVNNDDQEVFSKELQLDAKVLYFDIGENKRGRFLKGLIFSRARHRLGIFALENPLLSLLKPPQNPYLLLLLLSHFFQAMDPTHLQQKLLPMERFNLQRVGN